MKYSQQVGDDRGQMLLATGVVLLLSLLSMAVFSVKVAGLTSAHEPNADSVIETTKEVVDILPSLAENRTDIWISSGMERNRSLIDICIKFIIYKTILFCHKTIKIQTHKKRKSGLNQLMMLLKNTGTTEQGSY